MAAIWKKTVWKREFLSGLLREFAGARRRIVSDWRILIMARRICHANNMALPGGSKSKDIVTQLRARGDLAPIEGLSGIYQVEVPYAHLLETSEEQIIQEANPWAVFGYLTAMTYHGMTDVFPREMYAIDYDRNGGTTRVPLGTMLDEWDEDVPWPSPKKPDRVHDTKVSWSAPGKIGENGIIVGQSFGLPVYMTDRERTLIDIIRSPDKSGGIAKTLQAWRNTEDFDLNRLIQLTESYQTKILRQRVGFVLSQLGRSHPQLDAWQRDLQRGGSVKLVASDSYSDHFSPEWNLSLNVASSVLEILK